MNAESCYIYSCVINILLEKPSLVTVQSDTINCVTMVTGQEPTGSFHIDDNTVWNNPIYNWHAATVHRPNEVRAQYDRSRVLYYSILIMGIIEEDLRRSVHHGIMYHPACLVSRPNLYPLNPSIHSLYDSQSQLLISLIFHSPFLHSIGSIYCEDNYT